ncbi:MFS transporter [Xanthobacteraceae bacterium Astr-EGSB]|uniref:MFS transporter n=1 Tax=Astrobacterium formosum TaxID=3069710 RepID=UPI0027B67009|nr:MFS transporter [Xanthobacteraceae bacterium Astr-EGSB]
MKRAVFTLAGDGRLFARSWRLFLASQCLSSVGTWTTRIAVAWLLFRLTQSVLWLGIAAFSGQVVVLLLSPITAVLLDRCCRWRVLLLTQSLFCAQALVLFLLASGDALGAEGIVCLGMARGAIAAFDLPARQAFLSDLAGGDVEIKKALALDGLQVNVARVAGPLLAGFLIVSFGEGSCFLFDGVSYLIALAGLGFMYAKRTRVEGGVARDRSSLRHEVDECWTWLRQHPQLHNDIILLATTSVLCLPFTVLLPQYVHEVLNEGAPALGTLVSFSGIGAGAATLLLGATDRLRVSDALIRSSAAAAGICLAGLSAVQGAALASIAVAAVSFFIMLQISATAVSILGNAPSGMRGRLAALYGACFWGMAPVGSLLASALAYAIGPCAAFTFLGFGCALIATTVDRCRSLQNPLP